jgi:Icc-related predicted phosphoesterase
MGKNIADSDDATIDIQLENIRENMKILFLADEEEKSLYEFFDPQRLEGVDLIISCGDLSRHYLEYIVTMARCPLLYVRGNHDRRYTQEPPEGCIDIDDKIYDYKGLRILGLGGSMRYHDGSDMYTESEMKKRVGKLKSYIALRNGIDILVTHAPAKGYGDQEDLPHRGFETFNTLLYTWHPKYMVHGHIHRTYGSNFVQEMDHPSGTKIINAYSSYYLDFADDDHPEQGKTGSTLYDLYMGMQQLKRKKYQ